MRYYAEWLDGEYILLDQVVQGYDHFASMERAIKLHALLGSTLVLSDAQMIDLRTPITSLFLDHDFRDFLRKEPNFLALAADPVRGVKERSFAIAMKGIERLSNQANKPDDSFEMAITQIGEAIFHAGHFDADRYLNPGNARKGRVGRVTRRFPNYSKQLKGLLHVVDYFSRSPLPTTTTPLAGVPGRYDELLRDAHDVAGLLSEAQGQRIQNILRVQQEYIPEEQHGRRAAIRKVLGTGQWHNETWTQENLRLYLDVVHAWNCAINRSIAPDGGTLYEEKGDLPLSSYQRTVMNKIGWLRAGPMPYSKLTNSLRRFLFWDPLKTDWKHIAEIVRKTRTSAERLQTLLGSDDSGARDEALLRHASAIGNFLGKLPTLEISPWVWWIAKAIGNVTGAYESEWVDVGQETIEDAPKAYALIQRKLIVDTIMSNASNALNLQK